MTDVRGLVRTTRSAATFCLGVSLIANVFFASSMLDDLNLMLMVGVIALSFAASTGSSRVIGILLFGSSIALLLHSQAPLDVWKQALRENSYLIAMFVLVPLLSIPVQHGGYGESLREVFVRYANTDSRYYALVSIMAAFVGVLISIAAVPLTYEVSRASGCNYDEKLLASALSRGFITCMIWAPTSATIALVVQLTGVDWVAFFPFAIACALIAGAVGFLMTFVRDEAAMASLVFPVAWMAAIGRLPTYAREFRGDYFNNKLPQSKNQIVLFAGAGFFAQSIGYSHLGDALVGSLLHMTGQSVLLLTVAIIGITLATSAVGIHPIAVVAVVGGTMGASQWGVSPIYLALVLSISWAMGNALCPASANVVAVSDMVGQSPIKVSLRWNGPYVLVATAVLVLVLTMARMGGLL